MCVCVCWRTSRFSGLMSRWTMFIRCKYLMAPAKLYTIALASRSLYFVEEVMASNKSPPWGGRAINTFCGWKKIEAGKRRRGREEGERGHLDELHDQEELTGSLIHLDQLDDAWMSDPAQHRHFIFYQMLLLTHRHSSSADADSNAVTSWARGKYALIKT